MGSPSPSPVRITPQRLISYGTAERQSAPLEWLVASWPNRVRLQSDGDTCAIPAAPMGTEVPAHAAYRLRGGCPHGTRPVAPCPDRLRRILAHYRQRKDARWAAALHRH